MVVAFFDKISVSNKSFRVIISISSSLDPVQVERFVWHVQGQYCLHVQ